MNIRLTPPVKYLWRDGYKVEVTSISVFNRYLAQPFGVNWAPDDTYRKMGLLGHPGIDIAVPVGQPIYASHDGVVIEADNADDHDGLGISLYNKDIAIITWYWHNSTNQVSNGDFVKTGQLIGLSGGTGKVYGPHLHFQLHQTDAGGKIINYGNGFQGGIDPMPYFSMPLFDPNIMTAEFVNDTYLLFFGRLPEAQERLYWIGRGYRDLYRAMLDGRAAKFSESLI